MKKRSKIKKGEDKSGMVSSLIVYPVRKTSYKLWINCIENENAFQKGHLQNPAFFIRVNPFEAISCALKKFIFLKRVSVNPAVEKDAPPCLRYETGPTGMLEKILERQP